MEHAEIIKDESKKDLTPITIKVAEFKMSKYDDLKKERYAVKNKYCNMILSEMKIDEVRDIKNKLVKLRTAVDKDVDADIKVCKNVEKTLKSMGEEIVKILRDSEEKRFTDFVNEYDRKKAEEARQRIEKFKKDIDDFVNKMTAKISGLKSTKEADEVIIEKPDQEWEEFNDEITKHVEKLKILIGQKRERLKDQEEIEALKAKLAIAQQVQPEEPVPTGRLNPNDPPKGGSGVPQKEPERIVFTGAPVDQKTSQALEQAGGQRPAEDKPDEVLFKDYMNRLLEVEKPKFKTEKYDVVIIKLTEILTKFKYEG